ncbi:hypothetical protein ZIOFF_017068 [Zingiber officinale]|uniref:Uncharacterized protein n=1 Tax=Zingiber officinale TaxID=94328 RepID=A0A8J5H6N2_ZINOF|nr:hypothetical protein ZIOFF_017068 [Zingiber officinale]
MEEVKFDSNEMKDNTDHADQDLSPSIVEEVKLPEIGIIFSSEEEIRTFYNSYATNVGFGISKLGDRQKHTLQAYTAAKFADACLRGLRGRSGVEEVLPLGPLNEFERYNVDLVELFDVDICIGTFIWQAALAGLKAAATNLIDLCREVLEVYLRTTNAKRYKASAGSKSVIDQVIPVGSAKRRELASRAPVVVSTLQAICGLTR